MSRSVAWATLLLAPMAACGGDGSSAAPANSSGGAGSSGVPTSSSSSGESASGGSSGMGTSGGSSSGELGAATLLAPPKLARAGAFVTLAGSNFRSAQGDSSLELAGSGAAEVQAWDNERIRFRMPATAHGKVVVTLRVAATTLTAEIRVLGRGAPVTFAFGNGHGGVAAINTDGALLTWGCVAADPTGGTNAMCQPKTYPGNFASLGYGSSRLLAVDAVSSQLSVWTNRPTIAAYVPPGAWRSIHAGPAYRLAVGMNGSAVYWTADAAEPVVTMPAFDGATDIAEVSPGWYFATALLQGGTVRAVSIERPAGETYDCGQTDVPAGLSGIVAVSAGTSHALALREDGTVVGWGGQICAFNDQPVAAVPADLARVVAVSAGARHSLALRDDGTIVGWGVDSNECISGPQSLTDAIGLSTHGNFSVVLLADGTLRTWAADAGIFAEVANIPAGLHVKLPD